MIEHFKVAQRMFAGVGHHHPIQAHAAGRRSRRQRTDRSHRRFKEQGEKNRRQKQSPDQADKKIPRNLRPHRRDRHPDNNHAKNHLPPHREFGAGKRHRPLHFPVVFGQHEKGPFRPWCSLTFFIWETRTGHQRGTGTDEIISSRICAAALPVYCALLLSKMRCERAGIARRLTSSGMT
jgi:hypothetical protein